MVASKRALPLASVMFLFLLSGATSLVYEVLWLRELILIFGSTQFATSTVLATFMGGLALGAFAAGRWLAHRAPRPLSMYGWLEIGIGLYALAVPFLFASLTPLYQRIWNAGASDSFLALSLAKAAGIACVLLLPTVLMGASLPVLARQVADDPDRIGGKVGALYAVNTLGALLGVFLAGFVAIPGIGMRATLLATACVNLALGLAAIVLARRAERSGEVALPGARLRRAPLEPRIRLLLFVLGASGFVALVLEVAWTRVLALVMGSSVYAFSLMLLAFLAGLAAGGAYFSRWLRVRPGARPGRLLTCLLAVAALSAWGTAFLFGSLPRAFAEIYFAFSPGPNGLFALQLVLGLLVMFPATFALGGVFPAAVQLHARDLAGVGGSVGTVYASNTVGTILGAALAGFVFLPRFGVLHTVLGAAAVEMALAVAVGLAFAAPPVRRHAFRGLAIVAVGLGVGLVTPARRTIGDLLRPEWDLRVMNSGVYMNLFDMDGERSWAGFSRLIQENNEVVFAAEGYTASVFVADQPSFDNRYLSVNGKIEASTNADLETQLMCAHLPLLFHDAPRDVLVVGLASGITVGSVATHPVESIRVVEVEAQMIPAARLFAETNNHVLDDPRVTISINDARNELQFSPRTYDVIVSEPSNPWMTVASNLFTEDFFHMARTRLRANGVFSQWIQMYYLPADDLRSIVAAFRAAFPHVMLFETLGGLDLVLLGSEEPLEFDLERWNARMTELNVAMDLGRVHLQDSLSVLGLFRLGPAEIDRLVQGAAPNTDDNARVEFSAPRSLGLNTQPANVALLRSYQADPVALLSPAVSDPARRDRMRLDLARVLLARGDADLAAEQAGLVEVAELREEAERLRERAASDSDGS